jgi:hypothetical protein
MQRYLRFESSKNVKVPYVRKYYGHVTLILNEVVLPHIKIELSHIGIKLRSRYIRRSRIPNLYSTDT